MHCFDLVSDKFVGYMALFSRTSDARALRINAIGLNLRIDSQSDDLLIWK